MKPGSDQEMMVLVKRDFPEEGHVMPNSIKNDDHIDHGEEGKRKLGNGQRSRG